jgi:hypothetical protein
MDELVPEKIVMIQRNVSPQQAEDTRLSDEERNKLM